MAVPGLRKTGRFAPDNWFRSASRGRWLIPSGVSSTGAKRQSVGRDGRWDMLRKVNIAGLTMDPASNTPIIILKTEDDEQAVPIWIGLLEATSIASALQKIKYERPMTHDLFKNFAHALQISIERVEVCDLRDNTFFARIYFVAEGRKFDMDARPSDAIALALRFEAPIYVDDTVIQHSKVREPDVEVADTSEEGKKWADYLEKLSSDDFGKYKV
jgi:bifunctional DNase/RNase